MSTNNVPNILGVNIRCDISGPLVQGLQKAGCGMSIYIRPADREHPRLKPERNRGRSFDIVVFDIGRFSAEMSDEDMLGVGIVPEWFEKDVLTVLNGAAIVVLSPANLLQGVKAAFSSYVRRRPNAFREREPLLWRQGGLHPAVDVLRIWREVQRDVRPWWEGFAPPD